MRCLFTRAWRKSVRLCANNGVHYLTQRKAAKIQNSTLDQLHFRHGEAMMDGDSTTTTTGDKQPKKGTLDPLVELEQYKEKTKQWKLAVKVQLEDAASKNASLRDELKRVDAQHKDQQRSLRLELDTEFKERTQHKDDVIQQLTKDLAISREQHSKEIAELNRIHEQFLSNERMQHQGDLSSALEAAARQHSHEIKAVQEDAERTTRTLENVRHDLAVSQAKLTQLRSQHDEVLAQLAARNSEDEHHQVAAEEQQASSKEIQGLRAQLDLHVAKQMALSEQLERVTVEHRNEILVKDELREDEIQRREERIIVLQTILKQAQKESNEVHLRWADVQEEHHRATSVHVAEHQRLTSQVRDLVSQLEEVKKKGQQVEQEYLRAKRTVFELEEANVIRDKTFQELLMSEDQKVMMSLLEQRLDKATSEAARWQEQFMALRQSVDQEKQAVDEKEANVAEREDALEKRLAALTDKQQRIGLQEKRLREQHQQLSAQAEQLLSAARIGTPASSTSALLESGGVDDGKDLAAFGSTSSVLQAIRDSVTSMQHNYRTALARSNGSKKAAASLLFRHYRNILPLVFIVLFIVTLIYWWMFSGVAPSTSGDKSLTTFSDMKEELSAMKKEYGLLLSKLTQCCPDQSRPPELPVANFIVRKLL